MLEMACHSRPYYANVRYTKVYRGAVFACCVDTNAQLPGMN